MGPAEDKRRVPESNIFIREEWTFADAGILINHQILNILIID